ncbi:MAG: serine hydrolase domain-containing protein [Bacteroidota bacterium]
MNKILLSSCLILGMMICQLPAQNQPPIIRADIDTYVNTVLQRYGLPGAAVAVVHKGKLIHRQNYGFANLEHQVPVSEQSIFRIYSLTKLFVAVAAFQLIEAGKLSLEDKVSEYVDDLPEDWQTIQIKHCLTHSSGLPDMSPIPEFQDLTEAEAKAKVFAQRLSFPPGERYQYNQTNFWLLDQIIERLSGKPMADFVLEGQGLSETDTAFFSSDSRDIIRNRATAYFPFTKGYPTIDHPYLQGDYAYAMNGMNITLDALMAWDKKLHQSTFLNEKSLSTMWAPFAYSGSDKVFAYGWDKRILNGHDSYGFSGSLVTAYRTFPEENLRIFFLANGTSSFFDIEDIINHLASLVNEDIYEINTLVYEKLLAAAQEGDFQNWEKAYQGLKKKHVDQEAPFENQVNNIGYGVMRAGNSEMAVKIFALNAAQHPSSWNVFDSLGDGYVQLGERHKALAAFERALQLNVNNERGFNQQLAQKIQQLKGE